MTEIQSVFTLMESEAVIGQGDKSESGGVEAEKLAARIPPPVYKNQEGVVMTVLKDALARFRLTGEISYSVVACSDKKKKKITFIDCCLCLFGSSFLCY